VKWKDVLKKAEIAKSFFIECLAIEEMLRIFLNEKTQQIENSEISAKNIDCKVLILNICR
jgi:hypothetical protein